MPAKNQDLHGFVPDKSAVALLLIDVINDLSFPGGEQLERYATPMADRLARLKKRAKAAKIPVVYVNDNYGKWQSDFRKIVEHCSSDGVLGKKIAERLSPDDDDYFVVKPKHSGFYSTTLDVLLQYLHVQTVILTGIASDICVLFTANDAYMRDYELVVPADCVAAQSEEANDRALEIMGRVLKADLTASTDLDLDALVR
jgi:nicotinamidase-related amidase